LHSSLDSMGFNRFKKKFAFDDQIIFRCFGFYLLWYTFFFNICQKFSIGRSWGAFGGLNSFDTYLICIFCKLTIASLDTKSSQNTSLYHSGSTFGTWSSIADPLLINTKSIIPFSLMTSHTKTFLGNLNFLITLTLSCAKCSTHS
jgi:hypothetical protein